MTIAKYISELLGNYEGLAILTNQVNDGSDQYGLYKSPSRDIEHYIGDCDHITEYYQFFARQNALSESDRLDSDEFLETLTYWIDDFDRTYEFPELDENRTVVAIEVTGVPYPMEATDDDILYQMSLSITYDRKY